MITIELMQENAPSKSNTEIVLTCNVISNENLPNNLEIKWTGQDGVIDNSNQAYIVDDRITGSLKQKKSKLVISQNKALQIFDNYDNKAFMCEISEKQFDKLELQIYDQDLVASSNPSKYGDPVTITCRVKVSGGAWASLDIAWYAPSDIEIKSDGTDANGYQIIKHDESDQNDEHLESSLVIPHGIGEHYFNLGTNTHDYSCKLKVNDVVTKRTGFGQLQMMSELIVI